MARLNLQPAQSLIHMLHTQTTQAHIDQVGEQWTIAAAEKKKSPAGTGPSGS